MKANVPEKIYIEVTPDGKRYYRDVVKEQRTENSDIEYIRADAFIEKACDAYCKVCGHYPHSVPTHICRHDCRYFSDFKNYMKGE